MEKSRDSGERDAGHRERLQEPLPDFDECADLRIVGQPGVERRTVGVMQHIHHMRAADARRIIEARVLEAARLEVDDALAGPRRHVGLRAEHDRPGRASLHAGRLAADGDAVGAERAFVGFVVDLADTGNVERTALHAIAAADAVLADEVDDAVGVLHDCAGRGAGLEATRILAMHAAVLADQPFEIALVVVPFGEAHQRPGVGVEVEWVVISALEMADLAAQVVPFHAGGLARLAADASSDVDELGDFLLVPANRRRREGRGRDADIVLRLQIGHGSILHATGAATFSTLTRNALNSGVCVLASPTEGVSVFAP